MSVSVPMSLATTSSQPHDPIVDELTHSLERKVRWALAAHTEYSLDRILTQDNREKYTNDGRPNVEAGDLDEVFHLMRQLNVAGVGSETLGRIREDGTSFRDALSNICFRVASALDKKHLIYVELGPEPVKTTFILKALLQMGITIERYVAVDINPMSCVPMRSAVQEVLGDTTLEFVTTSFDAFRLEDHIPDGSAPALITMLGFQEGNDHPVLVNDWLRAIARPDDLVLSESQLYSASHAHSISAFYAHPAMQRFSRLAFETALERTAKSVTRFFLLPVFFQDGQTVMVAVLGEEFSNASHERMLHVTNFCLKLTAEQYRYYRLDSAFFEIVGETFTDDETLHFQLSRRI